MGNSLSSEYIWNELLNDVYLEEEFTLKTYLISDEEILQIVYQTIVNSACCWWNKSKMLARIKKVIRHREQMKVFRSIVWLSIFVNRVKKKIGNNCPN